MAVRAELFAQETLNGEIIVDNFAGGGSMTDYLEFLRSKIEVAPVSGFDVNAYPV